MASASAAASRESLQMMDGGSYYAHQLALRDAEHAREAAERERREAAEREAAEAMRSARMMELHRAQMRRLQGGVADSK
jgi:hypothetical protein